MGYVEKHLIPNETILYITRLSWIVYLKAILAFLAGFALLAWSIQGNGGAPNLDGTNPLNALAGLIFLAALTLFFLAFIRRSSSEFAVTDKRVIIKVGVISRRSIELLLTKVEAIAVDQTLTGRIFSYGTITIIGTGGTHEPFHLISNPLEFRRQTQIGATS